MNCDIPSVWPDPGVWELRVVALASSAAGGASSPREKASTVHLPSS